MPWHIKQKCLPAIAPSGFIDACDDCGPKLDYASRRVNRDTAWRGYIDARERFQEAYDHLHNLRQAYGPDFRCNDTSCRLCFARATRSAPPPAHAKGVCQYCRGVGSSPYCYCGDSHNPMTGFGRSYGYDDPALWDPYWCNCSGTSVQVASAPAPAPAPAPVPHYVAALPLAANLPPPVVPGGVVPMPVLPASLPAAVPVALANGAVQTTSESETQQIVYVQAASRSKACTNAHAAATCYGAQRCCNNNHHHSYCQHAHYPRGSNTHRHQLSADVHRQYLTDRHVATTRTMRTKRTTTTYMQQPQPQPQTQIIHIQAPVQQAPPPPPQPVQMVAQPPVQMVAQPPMQMVAQPPVQMVAQPPVIAPQPQPQPQLMYTDPAAYPRRPMVAVGFSFPHGEMSQRETWCRSSERLEEARSAYVSNLTHLKRLGLTKFNSSCCYGGYSYPSKLLSYRW